MKLVIAATLILALVGAGCGYRAIGSRGVAAGIAGLLVYPLWQAHKYVTRFDPKSGYFGLERLNVLLGEVVAFAVLGVVLGVAWNYLSRPAMNGTTQKSTTNG